MRKKNSLKNMIFVTLSNVLTILIGLFAQSVFIKILGNEYLGLNGLFTNIISMLGIVELGIGSAIIYNLYRPIAEEDYNKIKSLMSFYRKSYYIIAVFVLLIGLILIPILPFFINNLSININVTLIYLLFLLEAVTSYLISYKRSILYANQKNYIINLVHIFYTILVNLWQLIILYLTHNYYFYLFIKIVMKIIENIVITLIANKMYPFIKDKKIDPLDKNTEKDIFLKIKALFFHKIGSFIISGTDNIIISKMLGIVAVGLYSNYFLIINAIQMVFNQILQSITASVGNLLVTESRDKSFEIFKKIRFFNFWIACFSSVALLVIMDSFITIWIGKDYILSFTVLLVLCINLYQKLMRNVYLSFKEAAGIFYEDRFVPLIESFLNIVFSIILCFKFGLAGVFLGTLISGLCLWCFSYPKYVYNYLFKRNYKNYFIETMGYLLLYLIILGITYLISSTLNFDSNCLEFIKNIIISIGIPNIILLVIFYKTDNFQYYKKLLIRRK